ncbi:hypothetical protein [Pseudarthrobacter sp. NamE5]|uniref:hypothetical protein n=1 Tax=Pseudarthrobacter sp. NamE5 TaxID=2576839 RepID=UPI00110C149F|nr:hypothetical protein [Pseudarthrobacter sp. NamE5]TLM82831.1 hypothetical protein FDW84_15310 [Pseudarthrobacter sp. NamE5]
MGKVARKDADIGWWWKMEAFLRSPAHCRQPWSEQNKEKGEFYARLLAAHEWSSLKSEKTRHGRVFSQVAL